jgi:hypothetical protein
VHSAVPGNLAPPAESAAGRAVGRSLDGHSQSGNQHHNHGIRDIPTRALANQ